MSLASLMASYKANAGKKRTRNEAEIDIPSSSNGSNSSNSSGGSSRKRLDSALPVEDDEEEPLEMNGPPHYMILGAQKAGTMAAVKNLNKHPEIFCLKEPHFFDLAWHSKTPAQYRKSFQGTGKKILGEKTPENIYVDECAKRMKTVISTKNTKFVLFLRDPIKRAYSAWNMNINRNLDNVPFDEACERNFQNLDEFRSHGTAEYHYVQRGFYMDQIERFLKVFPNRDNLKIIIAEHMRDTQRSKEIYNELFEYLGASPFAFEPEDEHVGSYTKNKKEMSSAMEMKLMKLYAPHNERLFNWLGFRIEEWTTMASIRRKQTERESEKIS